jgi:hypothetical protein
MSKLSKSAKKDRRALYHAIDCMAGQHNDLHAVDPYTPKAAKKLRRDVKRLEYLMQDVCEMDRDDAQHYWWMEFDAITDYVGYAEPCHPDFVGFDMTEDMKRDD